MNKNYLSAFRILIFSFFIVLFFSFSARAQSIEPDEQIIQAMISYARKTENNGDLSRQRIFHKNEVSQSSVAKFTEKECVKESAVNSSLEQTAFEWLNQKRIADGLQPLKWNEDLAKIARYHSENMAQNNYFSHQEQDGSMVNNRADLFGVSNWRSIGENIAFNRGFKLPAESACQQWMNSPAHRENILDGRWKESGIGVAIKPDGTYYFTQVFILK